MRALPSKGILKEGIFYLCLGVILGIAIVNVFSKTSPSVAPKMSSTAFKVVKTKVEIVQNFGLSTVFSIFFSNLLSCAVIIGVPEVFYRLNREVDIYLNLYPKVLIFSIGFLSLGLIFPPFTSFLSFLLFSLYLLPHGIFEFSALLFAYSIPRERKLGFPVKRIYIIMVLLIISAFIETYFSMPFSAMILFKIVKWVKLKL